MRVGIFTESYPPLINGVSTSVQTLIGQLEQAGHTVFVFTSHVPGYQDDRPGVFRYPSVNSLVDRDYVLPIICSPRIAAAIPTLNLDIVHSQSPFFLGLLARRVAETYGLPHVATNHTLYTEYAHYLPVLPAWATRRMLVNWMHGFYNRCDQIVAPSELTKQVLKVQYRVRAPITVIPTGIPAPPYLLASPAETKRDWNLPPDARLLLFVGRLAPEKNLEMLLRAFAQIAAKTQDTYLVVAGSGKSHGPLRRLTEQMGLTSRVRVTGFVDRTKLDPLYAAAEVFLFPSKTETQGLAIGEALAAGVPCVVVNAGGAPESVENKADGFLVPDDPAQMAERTLQLLSDPMLHQKMSENARRQAATRTPEAVASHIITLYQDAIASRL